MPTFHADLSQLKSFFDAWGQDLFALCYLETGHASRALDLMVVSLCDMVSGPKTWNQVLQGREGFLGVAYRNCVDDSLRRPKRPKKRKRDGEVQETPRFSFPFSITDPLRGVMRLRLPHKGALFCRDRLELSGQEAARVLGISPARWQRLAQAAQKKAKITLIQSQAALRSLAPGEGVLDFVWEEFVFQQGKPGFASRQRYRKMRRAMDTVMPLLAVLVVALGVFAFFGVEYGWFGGTPYTQTKPLDGVVASDIYGGTSQEDVAQWVGDVSVFVPDGESFVEYVVHDTPGDLEDILRQMVYLGGAPEGVSLLSANLDDGGTESREGSTVTYSQGDTLSLTVELSEQAASLSGEEGVRMLQAMTATFSSYTQNLTNISIRCGGEELTVEGHTAQEFLGGELTVSRTVDTDYRT